MDRQAKEAGCRDRRIVPPFKGQKGRCSWCGTTDIPIGRKTWCSKKCVDEYLFRSDPSAIRKAVYKRDRGICATCGCDATAEFKAWSKNRKEVSRLAERLANNFRANADWTGSRWEFRGTGWPHHKEIRAFREYMLAKYAPGNWTSGRSTGWDADHIIPVVEGGGGCSLKNIRTLCQPCHKAVTRELAARRAAERRSNKSKP